MNRWHLLTVVSLLFAGFAVAQEAIEIARDGGLPPNADLISTTTTPRLIRFSGTLKNADGSARTGLQGLTFAIYHGEHDQPPLWMETLNAYFDAEGRYTALLGSTKDGVPIELFTTAEARWLGVRGQMPWDEEQRVLLVSVPYAMRAVDAETLGGLPSSAFLRSDLPASEQLANQGAAVAGSRPPPVFVLSGSGETGRIVKWTGSEQLGNSIMYDTGTAVGIGTTAPVGQFNVSVEGTPAYITLSAYQASANPFPDKGFLVRTARGTAAAPAALQNLDGVFNLYGQGYYGTGYMIAGGVGFVVDGTVAGDPAPNVPGAIVLSTTNAGTYAERMRIASSGNVGIGTTSPQHKLQVGSGTTGVSLGLMGNTAGGPSLVFEAEDGSDRFAVNTDTDPITWNDRLTVNAIFSANVLVLTGDGKVGIGTAGPAQKLDVAGNIKVTGTGNGIIFPDGTIQTTAAGSLAFDKPDNVRLLISTQQQQIERLQAELLQLRATVELLRSASPR